MAHRRASREVRTRAGGAPGGPSGPRGVAKVFRCPPAELGRKLDVNLGVLRSSVVHGAVAEEFGVRERTEGAGSNSVREQRA